MPPPWLLLSLAYGTHRSSIFLFPLYMMTSLLALSEFYILDEFFHLGKLITHSSTAAGHGMCWTFADQHQNRDGTSSWMIMSNIIY
jgi:hypothetical protein